MKLVGAIGLLDEADCIGACIEHHLSIGFDHVAVTDLGSTDGSLDIVRQFERKGRVLLLHGQQNLQECPWPEIMLARCREEFAPDYIAYIDPDEFWLPRNGHMSKIRGLGEVDVFNVNRYNVVPHSAIETRGREIRLPALADQIVFIERPVLDDRCPPLTPIVGGRIGPKVLHRAASAEIKEGWHDVEGETFKVRVIPDDVIVVHFPMPSYGSFIAKMANVAEFLRRNPQYGPGMAWQWRRYTRAAAEGRLRDEYSAQLFGPGEIAAMVAAGTAAPARNAFDLPG